MTFENDLIFSFAKIILITACTLAMMSSLTDFRYPIKKVCMFFGLYMLWVAVSTALILYWFGFQGIIRCFLFTISAPAIFLAYKMDRDAPAQSVFNYATQISLSLVLTMVTLLLNTVIGGGKRTDLLLRLLTYASIIFIEWRFLRPPFRRLAVLIQKGWGILSLIPVIFCLLLVLVGTIPEHYINNPINILYIFGIIITMLVVYFVVFQSLTQQYRLQIIVHDKDVLQVQISALSNQAATMMATEEKLRILRHDIRHFASVMEANLQSGSIEQAASTLSTFQSAILESSAKIYCTDYVINAMLVSYFDRAESGGIQTKVNFIAPPRNTLNSTAFAVMLANALENALISCEKGNSRQSITLKSRIFNGQYLMELSNTCDFPVSFDSEGLPISQNGNGHGIGTRSIVAYANEHNATVSFQFDGKRFILQMMLSLEDEKKDT